MRATTPLMSREARQWIKFHFDRLPSKEATFEQSRISPVAIEHQKFRLVGQGHCYAEDVRRPSELLQSAS
jgi:hypothetical protein